MDNKLLPKLTKGDINSFEEAVNSYERCIYRFIYHMVQHQSIAEKLTQDFFNKIYRNVYKYNKEFSFQPWLFKNAYTMTRGFLKKNCNSLKEAPAIEEHAEDNYSPSSIEGLAHSHILEQEFQKLKLENKAIFLLRFLHHFTFEEIADIVGSSSTTARLKFYYDSVNIAQKLFPDLKMKTRAKIKVEACEFYKKIPQLVSGNLLATEEARLKDHAKECTFCSENVAQIDKKDTLLIAYLDDFPFVSSQATIMEEAKNKKKRVAFFATAYRVRAYTYAIGGLVAVILSYNLLKPTLIHSGMLTLGTTTFKIGSYRHFAVPDKIVINNNGTTKEIEKGSDLFIKLMKETDNRFRFNVKYYSMSVKTDEFSAQKQGTFLLEFVYDDLKKTDGRKYRRLIFPMKGELSTCVFYDDGSGRSSGPLSNLEPPDKVIKLAEGN